MAYFGTIVENNFRSEKNQYMEKMILKLSDSIEFDNQGLIIDHKDTKRVIKKFFEYKPDVLLVVATMATLLL